VVSGYGVLTDPNKFDTQITAMGFGPNTLRWTTENGRCRTSDDVIITNNLAEAYAGPDQVVYASDIRLVGNKPASGTGQWVILAGRGTIQNPSNFETSVSGLGGGANTFSWTINNDGCIASDDVVITNKILPVTDFDPLPGKGCSPLTVSFVNNSIGGAPFHWDFGDGTTSSITNTVHTYYVPGNYLVRLTATGPDGLILHKDTVVVVYEIPVAQFKITPDTAYVPGNSINFFNLTENIDSLRWEFGDGNSSKEMNPSYKYAAPGIYNVILHVWSGFQCYDSVMVRNAVVVERAGIIKCPNAFTPNPNGPSGGHFNQNDFSNDVFHCYIEGVIEYHLEIYNRLGIRIFESDDINIGWDGYFKGKLVEEGAYVFRAYGRYNNGERFDHLGNIVLLR
jgi:PKD repeat protein